jgi:predicted Kef-type K+ transport protein
VVGLVGFVAPFLGCAAVAFYTLKWDASASLLCGVALSTTSMAVVYAVMLETGSNTTAVGKGILGACFINDLGTVIVLVTFPRKLDHWLGSSPVLRWAPQEGAMTRKRHTEEQIIAVLKDAQTGIGV